MKYFRKITGDRLYLSPISVEDTEIYTKWLNDKEVAKNIGTYHKIYTYENEKKWLEENKDYTFSIVLNDDRIIGNISLMDIDNISQTATLGIFIGEEKDRSRGYGKEAIKLILDYGFNTLNLNNIMLAVYSFNERAIKTYKKIGFKSIGIRRCAVYYDGVFYNNIFMDILKEEFNETKEFIYLP